MAKKRKNFMEGFDGNLIRKESAPISSDAEQCREKHDLSDGMADMANALLSHMSEEDREVFMLMMELALKGVDPDEYRFIYNLVSLSNGVEAPGSDIFDEDEDYAEVPAYKELEDSDKKTLLLKIQMKGVNKPPMWREVEVPADVDFMYLHKVIQYVMGFYDSHLWQFNKDAYDDALVIGVEMENEMGFGLEYVTNEASETRLTQYLQNKGDRLEYTYDFGDDWIFTVEVKKVIDKKSTNAVCTKYKSSLNPIEDFGGPWMYTEARSNLDQWDSFSGKEKESIAENHGFDSAEEYYGFLMDHEIDIEEINEILREGF